jgi:hypothetical protein
MLLATLFGSQPFLRRLFADAAYQGPQFDGALAKILPDLKTEIVKRSEPENLLIEGDFGRVTGNLSC